MKDGVSILNKKEDDTMALIDISGIDKAALLAALYNGAKPFGMGVHHYEPRDMTRRGAKPAGWRQG